MMIRCQGVQVTSTTKQHASYFNAKLSGIFYFYFLQMVVDYLIYTYVNFLRSIPYRKENALVHAGAIVYAAIN